MVNVQDHNIVMKGIANWFFFPPLPNQFLHPSPQRAFHCVPLSSFHFAVCVFPNLKVLDLWIWRKERAGSASSSVSHITNIDQKQVDNMMTDTSLKAGWHPYICCFHLLLVCKKSILQRGKKNENENLLHCLTPLPTISSVSVRGHKDWRDLKLSNQAVTLYHLLLTALSSHK